jgi:hypothetical protein
MRASALRVKSAVKVHLSETRENLRLGITTLRGLHARAFEWFETGLRRRT